MLLLPPSDALLARSPERRVLPAMCGDAHDIRTPDQARLVRERIRHLRSRSREQTVTMTEKEIDDLLIAAAQLTPEQQKYIERTEQGETIGAILTPSKWFDVGMKTAIGNVRRLLSTSNQTRQGE